jgi:tetratricopeptide (TPR) repeat protein
MKKSRQIPQERPARKPGRTIIFQVISLLIPFLCLFVLESLLRKFNYGYDSSLFIEYPQDKSLLYLNPEASGKYFSSQRNATTGNIEPFKKKKAPNTLRIFILGESTAIGYPYFHNGSFHRWLQYRLTHTYPGRPFEIVNIALTAVNSYTVLGFAKEVVNYEPDVLLIYTGHNEYYGALGVGSTENIGGNRYLIRLILWLKDFRITQLISAVYGKMIPSGNQRQDGTRMQRMAAKQEIPYQSDLYLRGVEQFSANMKETLELFRKRDIPVFLSNLVSNEKDLKPFVSFGVDSLRFPDFYPAFKAGLRAIKAKEYQSAYQFLKTANHHYPFHALCNYYLGQLAYAQKEYREAKGFFSKARDLDGLRFRAPAVLNDTIARLCAQNANAHLVDTKSVFEAFSEHGIMGDRLILEHVHPDLMGYALMSDAFYVALKEEKLIGAEGYEMSFSTLWKEMPVTRIDSLSGVYKVANLKNSWPFAGTMRRDSFGVKTPEERIGYQLANRKISWLDAMDQGYDLYIRNHALAEARKTVETLILEYPLNAGYYLKSAMLSGEMKEEKQAVFNFKNAFRLAPSFDIARYLFVIFLKQDKPSEAIPYLDYAIIHNTSRFDLNPVRNAAVQIIALENTLKKDSANQQILIQIASLYSKMNNREAADKYAAKALRLKPQNAAAKTIHPH